MNINAPFVTIDFLYCNGSVKAMNMSVVKNVARQSQLNNFQRSHLLVAVNIVQPRAEFLRVVSREREHAVKQSKAGCFTRLELTDE